MPAPEKVLYLLDGHALVYQYHFAFRDRPLINSKGVNTSAIVGFTRMLWDLLQTSNPSHIAVVFDPSGQTFRSEMYVEYKANREEQPEDIRAALPVIRRIVEAMNIPVKVVDNYEADDVIGTLAKQAEAEGYEVFMVTPDKDYGQLVSDRIHQYRPSRMGSGVTVLRKQDILDKWDIARPEQVIDVLALMGDSSDNIPGVKGIGEKTAAKLLKEFGSLEEVLARKAEVKGANGKRLAEHEDLARMSYRLATIDTGAPVTFNAEEFCVDPMNKEALAELFAEYEIRSLAKAILGAADAGMTVPASSGAIDLFSPVEGSAVAKTDADAASAKTGGVGDDGEDLIDFGELDEDGNEVAVQGQSPPSPGGGNASSVRSAGQAVDLFGNTTSGKASKAVTAPTGPPAYSVANHNMSTTDQAYHLIETEEQLVDLLQVLAKAPQICFDTETTGIDPNEAELVGMAFSVEHKVGYYVPVPADQVLAKAVAARFKAVLEDASKPKIGQNLKYDAIVMKWYGVDLAGPVEDTMLMHYVLSPELRHNLTYMSETYLKYSPQPIEELIGKKGKSQGTMRDVPVADAAAYAAEDADITLRLYDLLRPKLASEEMAELYERVEAPLVYVLRDMEYNGVALDTEFLAELSQELMQSQALLQDEIYEAAGRPFNIDSPKQVGEILFDELKVPYKGSKTKSGQYKTDEFTMQDAAKLNPVAQKILDYRQLSKLRGTYVDALPKLLSPRDNRIHSSFNQAAVATGRLSSSNPNLQNIPMRTDVGRQIRKAFIPHSKDHVIVSADYSQIELRLIAEIAGEQQMLEAFNAGQDIHRSTAALVYGVPYGEVTDDQRRKAKTVNFGIIYGAGANRMANELEIDRKEAGDLIKRYFETYHQLQAYMDSQVKLARKQGYVTTLLGRRRYLRDINSANGNLRSYAERNAVNTPIQGTAADLMKLAMINVHARMRREGMESLLTLQVHDELVFDAKRSEVEALRKLVKEEMEGAMPDLKVKLLVESGVGENWLEAH